MKSHLASAATLCLIIVCLLAHRSALSAQSPGNLSTPASLPRPLSASIGEPETAPQHMQLSEVASGTLLFKDNENFRDDYEAADLLHTKVSISVNGMLSRTTLKQSFKNDSDTWREAVYAFPLPDNASVDKLEMRIGERIIKGVLQTKEQARQTYQVAKDSGRKTTLLELQRSNLFTSNVANIPPGESIDIAISFQSAVNYTDGSFSLHFPLTITPRYIPGQRLRASAHHDTNQFVANPHHGWGGVADADAISPPMVPAQNAAKTELTVTINAGLPLESINSESHHISTVQTDDTWQVTTINKDTAMDRDFTLTWNPVLGKSPHAAVFRHDSDKHSYASFMLLPPQSLFDDAMLAREVIFVIDTSGSMQGNSIVQARKALQLGIERLQAQDVFNVIEFDDNTQTLFRTPVAATIENKRNAIQWVQSLTADGGTEIAAAMSTALSMQKLESLRLRQIVFVTDGSVGNEDEIFHYIKNNLDTSRLFTVGIGAAPNRWFMRKAAEIGRGTYTTIAHKHEVKDKMLALFNKLERPVLTNVNLQWNNIAPPELYPAIIPDLYAGEPILADARWQQHISDGSLSISGNHGTQPWKVELRIRARRNTANDITATSVVPEYAADTNENLVGNTLKDKPDTNNSANDKPGILKPGIHKPGIQKQWAKRKIESLENNLLFGADIGTVKQQVTDTALEYGLITKYTSLVAVDQEISRNPSVIGMQKVAVPSAMPHGNTMAFPQGSLGVNFRILLFALFSVLAAVFSLATLQQVKDFE